MKDRTTPQLVTFLRPQDVFVFGSNLSGRHGKGAAKTAMQWGAKYGQPSGIMGKTYGIPTKYEDVRYTLPLNLIQPFVSDFIRYAEYHTGNTFLLTEIGCGLAGYTPVDIAPMFSYCRQLSNVHLPASFWEVLC